MQKNFATTIHDAMNADPLEYSPKQISKNLFSVSSQSIHVKTKCKHPWHSFFGSAQQISMSGVIF